MWATTDLVCIPLAKLFKTKSFNGGLIFLYTVGLMPSFPCKPFSNVSNASLHHPTPKPSMFVSGLGDPESLADVTASFSAVALSGLDRAEEGSWLVREGEAGLKEVCSFGRKCSSTGDGLVMLDIGKKWTDFA